MIAWLKSVMMLLMNLPEAFIKRMESRLGSACGDFLAAHEKEALKAFHLNTARISVKDFEAWLTSQDQLCASLCAHGSGYTYTFNNDRSIGNLPLHHAGAIYSQDAAAMLPVLGVDIKQDMRILDMCATPGGKTSQLAMSVDGGSGFVLANEPNLSRNRILISNIERMGYRNVITSCLDPSDIAMVYPEYFDLILVDAPCSGEGMFRKYPESINEWSEENIALCAARQRDILDAAVSCLKPGGMLIYSTCTYALEEDEEQVEYLISRHGLSVFEPSEKVSANALKSAPGSYRCYPHLYDGEGQFMAYLKKPGDNAGSISDRFAPELSELSGSDKNQLVSASENAFDGIKLLKYRDRYVCVPACPERLPKRGITSIGVTAAVFDEKKKRFVPHHQFFSAYGGDMQFRIEADADDPVLMQYLNGMELPAPDGFSKGYGAVCVLGVPIGGVRIAGGRAKNLYPKGLRETHL